MKKKTAALIAAPVLALGMTAFSAAPAFAADNGTTYQAQLEQLNHSGASGSVMVTVNGDQAHVHLEASGLAKTFNGGAFPHVAHIHIGGQHMCPTPDADKNGDGVVSTPEAAGDYGKVGTTFSTSGSTGADAAVNVKVAAGAGGSFTYDRTFTLNDATATALKNHDGVVVVHGLDPATLSATAQKEKSPLVSSLPLAATAPALCGALNVSQMTMPNGAAATGGGSAPIEGGMIALGGGLLLAAGGTLALRRRFAYSNGNR